MPTRFRARRAALLLLALLCAPLRSFETDSVPDVPGVAPPGEVLEFRIEWRFVHAGNARMQWDVTASTGEGSWQTDLLLESAGLVSKLYTVKDSYTSQLDDRLCATSSLLKAQEGTRSRETKVTFDFERRKASYLERDLRKNVVVKSDEISIPGCVYDVIGGLYRLRTMKLEPGQTIRMPVSNGKKSANARVEVQGREQIKTPAGTFQTIRCEAFLFNDVIYRRNGRLYVWLSDDKRRLPVQIRAQLSFPIGAITVQLEKVKPT